MTNSAVRCAGATREELQGEPDTLGRPLTPQAVIDALIDIDLAYERKCQELNNSRLGATYQYHLLEKLREQHRERREPYVRHLMALQDGLKAERET
ncbi:hypothetical protein [Microvirga arabica]|uniref:hypothetical protein n=1 Tax=Microvirga arabica TaxID=1128671 RepID=UPI0019399251|nr:hypothetical protein [Microvirga arabica]MBM1169675.1 hypothetical protein [Microvirga arabica]